MEEEEWGRGQSRDLLEQAPDTSAAFGMQLSGVLRRQDIFLTDSGPVMLSEAGSFHYGYMKRLLRQEGSSSRPMQPHLNNEEKQERDPRAQVGALTQDLPTPSPPDRDAEEPCGHVGCPRSPECCHLLSQPRGHPQCSPTRCSS